MADGMARTLAAAGEAARQQDGEQTLGAPVADCPLARGWIEVRVAWLSGTPLAGQAYQVVDGAGREHRGKTNGQGLGRVEHLPPGDCFLSLVAEPDADRAATPPPLLRGTLGQRHDLLLDDWDLAVLDAVADEEDEVPADSTPDATDDGDEEHWDLAGLDPVPDEED